MGDACTMGTRFRSFKDAVECLSSLDACVRMPEGHSQCPDLHIEELSDGYAFAPGLPQGCTPDVPDHRRSGIWNELFSDNELRARECAAALSIKGWPYDPYPARFFTADRQEPIEKAKCAASMIGVLLMVPLIPAFASLRAAGMEDRILDLGDLVPDAWTVYRYAGSD